MNTDLQIRLAACKALFETFELPEVSVTIDNGFNGHVSLRTADQTGTNAVQRIADAVGGTFVSHAGPGYTTGQVEFTFDGVSFLGYTVIRTVSA
jgi:hypothetical protein